MNSKRYRQPPMLMAHHGMRILAALLILFSISAQAQTRECFEVLENSAPVISLPSPAQREAAISLALKQLQPKNDNTIHQLHAGAEIQQLSQLNLERLTRLLGERFPHANQNNVKLDAVLKKVDFVSLRLLNTNSNVTTLRPTQDFYNILNDSSRTVGFRWTATLADNAVLGLQGRLGGDFALLQDPFILAQGFVVPHFISAYNFISFFDEWDRPAIESFIHHNRFNLPSGVETPKQLMAHLEKTDPRTLFPETEYYRRLAPLRQQLYRYLLTVEDAKVFSLLLLKLHVLNVIRLGEDVRIMLDLLKTAPNRLMDEAFVSIGWEGLELRAPLSIEPAKLSVVRFKETRPRGGPFSFSYEKPFTVRHNDL